MSQLYEKTVRSLFVQASKSAQIIDAQRKALSQYIGGGRARHIDPTAASASAAHACFSCGRQFIANALELLSEVFEPCLGVIGVAVNKADVHLLDELLSSPLLFFDSNTRTTIRYVSPYPYLYSLLCFALTNLWFIFFLTVEC